MGKTYDDILPQGLVTVEHAPVRGDALQATIAVQDRPGSSIRCPEIPGMATRMHLWGGNHDAAEGWKAEVQISGRCTVTTSIGPGHETTVEYRTEAGHMVSMDQIREAAIQAMCRTIEGDETLEPGRQRHRIGFADREQMRARGHRDPREFCRELEQYSTQWRGRVFRQVELPAMRLDSEVLGDPAATLILEAIRDENVDGPKIYVSEERLNGLQWYDEVDPIEHIRIVMDSNDTLRVRQWTLYEFDAHTGSQTWRAPPQGENWRAGRKADSIWIEIQGKRTRWTGNASVFICPGGLVKNEGLRYERMNAVVWNTIQDLHPVFVHDADPHRCTKRITRALHSDYGFRENELEIAMMHARQGQARAGGEVTERGLKRMLQAMHGAVAPFEAVLNVKWDGETVAVERHR